MDYSKATLLVISGPNGAGKSTFIASLLPEAFEGITSFDRDKTRMTFEQELQAEALSPDELTVRATRLMEASLEAAMDKAITAKDHFVLETPLSHPDYWKYIDRFERNGYQVQLNYLCLDNIRACKFRVEQRVREGGHYVDARTIKGVYEMNLQHINDYQDTFRIIELYDGMTAPALLVKIEDSQVLLAKEQALKKQWIRTGLPVIAAKLAPFLEAQQLKLKQEKSLKSERRPKL
ncbi:Predicted ABC-type ATPase [Mucilaginibacter pineti]|uniref:Predicted ABC-type ATPase n=1 Tax=Mucilaginibacter pineti TaxID=1391627 RepID=A0A1G7LBL5_9SPHI|nr:zeta toxin family protein [Mucilaginibacter pineti]SDF46791.1 Predicted ABC-type ATPase [Mucilaginibacter pineti]